MPLAVSLTISTFIGVAVVTLSSPTIPRGYSEGEFTWLKIVALASDALIAVQIAYTILCRIEIQFVAKGYLFPWTSHPENRFGPPSFDLNLITFILYHEGRVARIGHAIWMTINGFLWMFIVRVTFGVGGIGALVFALIIQAASSRDPVLVPFCH